MSAWIRFAKTDYNLIKFCLAVSTPLIKFLKNYEYNNNSNKNNRNSNNNNSNNNISDNNQNSNPIKNQIEKTIIRDNIVKDIKDFFQKKNNSIKDRIIREY